MRHRDQITLGLCGAALVVSVLFVGGVLRWTQALVGALIAAAVSTQLLSRRRLDRISPIVALLGVAIVLSLIQLIPMPDGILHALSPVGHELRSDGAALAGTDPWPSLSLDPSSTLRATAFYVILLGVALIALRFAAAERSRYLLLAGVAITCGLAALVTGVHTLFASETLFGMYKPVHASPPVLGPLLNTNHLGSLMALGAVISLGLTFYNRQAVQLRVLWVLIAIGCAVVALATASRGAALSLAFGVAVTVALIVANRMQSTSGRRRRSALINDLPIAIVVAFGLGLAVFTTAGKVASQLDDTTLTEVDQPASKFAAWRSSFELLREAPVAGIGRGALEPAFTRVHPASAYVTFSHLENEYVQAVVEWGIPGSILLLMAAIWCAATAARRWRDGPLAACALGALVGVLFHSSVDFGIELLGLAVPVTIVAATVLLVPFRETTELGRVRVWRVATLAGLAIAVVVLVLPISRGVGEDRDTLVDDDVTASEIKAAIERHPLDYLGYAKIAGALMNAKDPRSVRFLNHALALHPTHPGLHRLAARMLVASDRRQQAAIEFSLAMRGTLLPHKLLGEILTLLPNANEAASAIPVDYPKQELILVSLKQHKREDVSLRWLGLVAQRSQTSIETIDRLFELAMLRKQYDVAENAARLRLKAARTTTSQFMLAKALFARNDYETMLSTLGDVRRWSGRIDEQGDAWLLVCDVYIDRKRWDPALECLHRLDGSGLAIGGRRDAVNRRLKAINEQRVREARQEALDALQKSLQQKPRSL